MKILLAPDSFKGSLSAPNAVIALEEGLRRVWQDSEIVRLPVADGGEGVLDVLLAATGGKAFTTIVTDAMGSPISARWGTLPDRETAVIELAQAAGLTQISAERRNPAIASTYGIGELILEATRYPGVRRLIIGLGGSATNDGGAGILTALGVRLLDEPGDDLPPGGIALSRLHRVDRSGLKIDPSAFEIHIACDVDNPLIGDRGASVIFAPQKGATGKETLLLDAALTQYARILSSVTSAPGDGAAGGTTFGLRYLFPHAILRPGIDIVLDTISFDRHLANADLVITGEGRLDAQTLGGKAIAGVARRAKAAGVPVCAIVGSITPDLRATLLAEQIGVAAVLSLTPGPCSLDDALANASDWLADAAERAARCIEIGRKFSY
jgi:glycerate kinase